MYCTNEKCIFHDDSNECNFTECNCIEEDEFDGCEIGNYTDYDN